MRRGGRRELRGVRPTPPMERAVAARMERAVVAHTEGAAAVRMERGVAACDALGWGVAMARGVQRSQVARGVRRGAAGDAGGVKGDASGTKGTGARGFLGTE